jgi:thiol-disulfide isomerase/thioredoxin
MLVRISQSGIAGLVLALLAVPTAVLTAGASALTEVPRYRLEVGQELVYRGTGEFQYEGGKFVTGDTWRFWVVARNPDRSWRLLILHARKFSQVRDSEQVDADEGDPPRIEFAWCDISPDGQIADNSSLGLQLQPSRVLPRLPPTLADAGRGWKFQDVRMDETADYRLEPDDAPDGFRIAVTTDSPMNVIYGSERRSIVTFDRQRGLPEKIVMENRQTYGFKGQGVETLQLAEVQQHPEAWCKQRFEESAACFDRLADYDQLCQSRKLEPDELKAALQRAEADLKQFVDGLQSAELKTLLAQQLARRQQEQQSVIEEAEERAALLGATSPEWSATDLAGKAHAMNDYHGNVVVLDFWYRGCGWCIRAMPQVKEIAARFQGRPVQVLGMNTDEREADARFVVDTLGVDVPTLKAKGLPEKYNVTSFPTLLVLDQQGIIRDVHVGYSPTLANDVAESIEGLLRNRP